MIGKKHTTKVSATLWICMRLIFFAATYIEEDNRLGTQRFCKDDGKYNQENFRHIICVFYRNSASGIASS